MKIIKMNVLLLVIIILFNCIPSAINNSKLANSKWECLSEEGTYFNFGQTSFSGDFFWFPRIQSGDYRIEGDTVIFTFSNGNEQKGSLIGNELTAFGASFRRID